MFWDLGSLHQKPRVGGSPGCSRRDGSDLWQSPVPQGDNSGVRVCAPPPPTIACWARRSELRNESFTVLCIVTGSSLFWDFGSLHQRRCGVTSHARQPCFCPCRCGDFGFVSRQASRTSHSICFCSSRRGRVTFHVLSRQACHFLFPLSFSLSVLPVVPWCCTEGRTSVTVRFRPFSLSAPGVAAPQSSMHFPLPQNGRDVVKVVVGTHW